jgi:SNF2 family DNA or RNA helicase
LEDEGGSSQDKLESDFIDDGAEDARIDKQNQRDKKGHDDDSDQDKRIITSDQISSDEAIYDDLPPAIDLDHGKFRYDSQSKNYHLKSGFHLPKKIFKDIFPHQIIGVQWLHDLFKHRKGGVLGDDMGLGKTVQIATLLKGLFDSG